MVNRPYKDIPTKKLEQIHYCQERIIKMRTENKQIAGIQIKAQNIGDLKAKLSDVIKDILKDSAEITGQQPVLGMQIYIATMKKLPLDKVKELEKAVREELRIRREYQRANIDAGNLDKEIKKE